MLSCGVLFLNLGAGDVGVFVKLHMEATRSNTFPFCLGLTDPHAQRGQPEQGMERCLSMRADFLVEGAMP